MRSRPFVFAIFLTVLGGVSCESDNSGITIDSGILYGSGTGGSILTMGSGGGIAPAGSGGIPSPTSGTGGAGGSTAGAGGTPGATGGTAGSTVFVDAGVTEPMDSGAATPDGSGQAGTGAAGQAGTGAAGQGGTAGSGSSVDDCPHTAPSNCDVVDSTIEVGSGQTFDGECKCYEANPFTLGDGSQAEDQKPVFRINNEGKLMNIVLGSPAADGIHCYGNVELENIVWTDIGEDALTIKTEGTVTLNRGYAANGSDKVFQINAPSTFRVSNFTATNAGKFIRQNGGTTFTIDVVIDACDISDMDECIFRTDSWTSTVTMTNTRYHDVGSQLFIIPNPANVTQSGNTPY